MKYLFDQTDPGDASINSYSGVLFLNFKGA